LCVLAFLRISVNHNFLGQKMTRMQLANSFAALDGGDVKGGNVKDNKAKKNKKKKLSEEEKKQAEIARERQRGRRFERLPMRAGVGATDEERLRKLTYDKADADETREELARREWNKYVESVLEKEGTVVNPKGEHFPDPRLYDGADKIAWSRRNERSDGTVQRSISGGADKGRVFSIRGPVLKKDSLAHKMAKNLAAQRAVRRENDHNHWSNYRAAKAEADRLAKEEGFFGGGMKVQEPWHDPVTKKLPLGEHAKNELTRLVNQSSQVMEKFAGRGRRVEMPSRVVM
jgi:hypothetical protein